MANRGLWIGTAALGAALAALLVVFLAAGANPARAAFPGHNGKIVFEANPYGSSCEDGCPEESEIYAVTPNGFAGPVKLTDDPATWDAEPDLSADGSRIVFVRDGVLHTMGADGSGEGPVAGADGPPVRGIEPSWSPDGEEIVFVKASGPNYWEDTEREIWMVGADGSGERRLTEDSVPQSHPAFSPDGKRIAYSVDVFDDSSAGIWVMGADGSGQERIVAGKTGVRGSPDWSPDGQRIAYNGLSPVDVDADGLKDFGIVVADADGSDKRWLGYGSGPAFSPDGEKVAFESDGINVVNADGSGQRHWVPSDRDVKGYRPDWGTGERDTTAPVVSDLRPAPGSKVLYHEGFSPWMWVGAATVDETSWLSPEDMRLYLDGRQRSFTQDQTYGGIQRLFQKKLSPGEHTAKVVATDDAGNTATRTWSFEVEDTGVEDDAVDPVIATSGPAPGSEIRDRTPTIGAVVRDETSELAKSDITLRVDGREKGFSYDPDTERLSRATKRLSLGRHTVEVEATDGAGNTATKKWSFKVVQR